jgi:hypothetical protein
VVHDVLAMRAGRLGKRSAVRDFAAAAEPQPSGGGHRTASGGPLYLHGSALAVLFTSALTFAYMMREDKLSGRGMHRNETPERFQVPATAKEGTNESAGEAPGHRMLGGLPRVYLDLSVGDAPPKRVVIELRSVRRRVG